MVSVTDAQMAWQKRGACKGVTLSVSNLFTEHDRKQRVADPICLSLCSVCEVQPECLDYGMAETEGIWGGTTPYQRKQLKLVQHRVRCPGCGSTEVQSLENADEICVSCGFSWCV